MDEFSLAEYANTTQMDLYKKNTNQWRLTFKVWIDVWELIARM